MTYPFPYALAQVVVNGGAPSPGGGPGAGVVIPASATIAFSGVNTTGWVTSLWEIYDYPPGWSAPAGWTLISATGVVQYVGTQSAPNPPVWTAPNISGWGKWGLRLTVNNATDPQGAVNFPRMVDTSLALTMYSLHGFHDGLAGEQSQFIAASPAPNRQWAEDYKLNVRTMESLVASGGSISPVQGAVALSSGVLNSNVAVSGLTSIRFTGCTAGTSLGGLVISPTPVAGVPFDVEFDGPMSIVDSDASSSLGNRILTGTGGPVTLPPGQKPRARFVRTVVGGVSTYNLQTSGVHQNAHTINVKDFGAVGDGVTDNATAFANVVTTAKALSTISGSFSGCRIFFPHGVYLCSTAPFVFDMISPANAYPSITLCGEGGNAAANYRSASALVYTGAGAPAMSPLAYGGSNGSPPVVTITGTPAEEVDLTITITTPGTQTGMVFKYSLDGGNTFTTGVSGSASPIALGASGLSAHFGVGNYQTSTSDGWFSYTINAFITARSSFGFSIEKMSVLYSNAAFFGTLVSVEVSPLTTPPSIYDGSGCVFSDLTLGSDGGLLTSATNLILLDGMDDGIIKNCFFQGCITGIRGMRRLASFGQTNQIRITNCTFLNCSLAGITNPGTQGITVEGGSFEGNAMPRAIYADFTVTNACEGFTFKGNWLGDVASIYRAIPWIDPQWMVFEGAVFSGNFFYGVTPLANASSKDSIKLGSSAAVEIVGNSIGTIDLGAGNGGSLPQSISIHGNALISGDQHNPPSSPDAPWFRGLETGGTLAQGTVAEIWGNFDATNDYPSGMSINTFEGHVVTRPIQGTAPTFTNQATHLAVAVDGNPGVGKGSNDMAGRLTITVTSAPTAAGVQFSLNYVRGYDVPGNAFTSPKVILQPEDAGSAALLGTVYPTAMANNVGFNFNSTTGLAIGVYTFTYLVIG